MSHRKQQEQPTTSEFLLSLLMPAQLLYHAIYYYITTILTDLKQHHTIQPDIRGRAFGSFWTFLSGNPDPTPDEELIGSAKLVPPLLAQSTGIVLDIGPGSGSLIDKFSKAAGNITKIYGAEPCVELHPLLRKNAAAATASKIGEKYVPINADASFGRVASELVNLGVVKTPADAEGFFDTVVCVRVLCGVPNPHQSIADIHRLLKPGGKLLVCEHTANPWRSAQGSLISRVMQSFYEAIGWSYFVGDCRLTRDLEEVLKVQDWESVKIDRYFPKVVLTYICGVLVKKRG